MVEISTINPRVIFVSATTPTDLTEGKLWYNTSDNSIYVSDGSTYSDILGGLDLTNVYNSIAINSLNILQTQAELTATATGNAYFFGDVYTDATGYSNEVDTGNTTALFSTNLYKNGGTGASVENAHGVVFDGTFSNVNDYGMKILTNTACNLTKVTKSATSNATTCYLRDSSFTLIDTQSFVGNDATFNQSLNNATQYYITTDGNGGNVQHHNKASGVTYPIADNHINWIAGWQDTADSSIGAWDITSITTTAVLPIENYIVQTNPITIPASKTTAIIVADETTAGTGTITYDISTDNGSNYQTAQTSDTEITLTNVGTQLILKQNLNAGASSGTASATNFGVLLI